VNGWTILFLGIIAAATLASAIVQIGLILAAGRLARRLDRLVGQVETELKPMFESMNAIGRDASRAASVAAAQVERADRLFADLAARIEQTVTTLQDNVLGPAREGRALFAALRAALAALRTVREETRRRQRGSEDEDALFI
jgi:hypothetical protein